jgi:iron-sulfur cluster assembly accessory protein
MGETQMLTLTDSAQKAVTRFMHNNETPVAGLRISVTGGGCSGLQYAMALEEAARDDDVVLACGAVSVFVDPLSAPYLNGVTVDFQDSMDGSGFKFQNPNAQNSCGCGSSFSA